MFPYFPEHIQPSLPRITELIHIKDGIAAVDIQHPKPEAAAQRWSELFESPVENGTELKFARGHIRFVPPRDDDGTGVIGLDIEVKDPAASLAAAKKIGLLERDGAVLISGTWMKPVKA